MDLNTLLILNYNVKYFPHCTVKDTDLNTYFSIY